MTVEKVFLLPCVSLNGPGCPHVSTCVSCAQVTNATRVRSKDNKPAQGRGGWAHHARAPDPAGSSPQHPHMLSPKG